VADLTFIDNVQVSVTGGPSTLAVSVDQGATGTRGSRIWAGEGNPATVLSTQIAAKEVLLNDYYVNTRTSDSFYSWFYVYQLNVGNVPTWTPLIKLNPTQYSSIVTTTFTLGAATILIPLSSITSATSPNLANFIITQAIESSVPLAVGFVPTINGTNLQLTFSAAKYISSTWSTLTGSQKVHITVAYTG
jgi:hypothetical protein